SATAAKALPPISFCSVPPKRQCLRRRPPAPARPGGASLRPCFFHPPVRPRGTRFQYTRKTRGRKQEIVKALRQRRAYTPMAVSTAPTHWLICAQNDGSTCARRSSGR